jgi:predicted transcriptional regulator
MAQNEENADTDIIEDYLRKNKKKPPAEEPKANLGVHCDPYDIDLLAERRALLRHHQVPPYYAQLPDGLLLTKKVSPDAKVVYALLHKHARIKNLNRRPVVEISQELLATEMDRTEETIRTLLRELLEEGWIGKFRRGKKKVNRYSLYPRSERTWQAYLAIERVQIRIQRDQSLAKRLRESLYPQTDHKDSCGHPHPSGDQVTTSALGPY